MAVCHDDNRDKLFQRPACVREPGEGRTDTSPRRSTSSSGKDLLRVSSSHSVSPSHQGMEQGLPEHSMAGERAAWTSHTGTFFQSVINQLPCTRKRSSLCFKTQKVSAQQNPLFSPCSVTTPSWRRTSSESQDLVNSGQTAPTLSEEQRIEVSLQQPQPSLAQVHYLGVHTDLRFHAATRALSWSLHGCSTCESTHRPEQHSLHPTGTSALGTPEQNTIQHRAHTACFSTSLQTPKTWNIAIIKYLYSIAIWFLWCIEMQRKQRKILGKLQ